MVWNKIARFILRKRFQLTAVLIILTAFMAYNAYRVQLSYEFSRVLPDKDESFVEYMDFKKTFGEDGSVMVVGFKDSSFFELKKFNEWYDLNKYVKSIDGIEEVVSVARLYNLSKNDSLHKFELKKIINRRPESQAEVDSIRKVIFSLPFYNSLIINKKTSATLMAITFDQKKLNTRNRIEIVNKIKEKAYAFGKSNAIKIHISGLPFIRTAITQKVSNELIRFLLMAIFATSVILLIFFRSFNAVFFPMLVVITGVVWSLGTLSLCGFKITMLTALIPSLIIIIGIPNSIFLLNKYQHEFKKHGNKMLAVTRSIEKIGMTTFLANLTTAIGFVVFYFTHSSILVEFGLVAAINVMATYVISVIFIPIVFSFLPPPSIKHTEHLKGKFQNFILEKIDYWVHYQRRPIYILVLLIVAVSIFGMTKINTVGYIVDDLPKKDPVYMDLKFFEENFKGVLPFEIVINTGKKGGALSPSTLSKINAAQKIISEYDEFSKPVSVVEAIKFSNQALNNGDRKKYVFPDVMKLSEIAGYTTSEKSKIGMFRSFLDSSRQMTRISVQMADVGTVKTREIISSIKPRLDSVFTSDKFNYQVKLTGNSLIFLKGNDYLIYNLGESVLLAILLISIIMILLFMSARMIALSILPSIIPLFVTAGLMGFFDIHLKPSTVLIFSIAFGIASDGTIYFLTKYRQELKHFNMSISKTVSMTIRETGVSMIYTAIILFCGFSIFAASEFGGTAALGMLISFTLLIGMCSNLILLPAFLISLEKKMTTKAFLNDSMIETYDEDDDIELEDLKIRKKANPEQEL